MHIINDQIQVKPYTKKELSGLYQISPRAFSSWLKPFQQEIGEKMGRYYNVKQVKTIFEKLGQP